MTIDRLEARAHENFIPNTGIPLHPMAEIRLQPSAAEKRLFK
jgi:hypothetical protein